MPCLMLLGKAAAAEAIDLLEDDDVNDTSDVMQSQETAASLQPASAARVSILLICCDVGQICQSHII